MRLHSGAGRFAIAVGAACLSVVAGAQAPRADGSRPGRLWIDVAGGVNSRGFAVVPAEVSAATAVGLRYSPSSGPLSFRVGAMAKSSGSVNGQVAALTSALISLPSRRVGMPGLAPYALLGAGWYGLTAEGAGGGAHAGLGFQFGGSRQAVLVEWSRHSLFNVSQLTLGLAARFR